MRSLVVRDGEFASPGLPLDDRDIVEWLLTDGRLQPSLAEFFDELCWRLSARGMPLWRTTLNMETLHPQILGVATRWWRDRKVTEEFSYTHGIEISDGYLASPLYRVTVLGETIRCRIALGEGKEFPIIPELAAMGATDYISVPMVMSDGTRLPTSWATDAPDGFSDAHIADLQAILPALAAVIEIKATRRMAVDLLNTYLGRQVGQRILSGKIHRGDGERIFAVIWYCDLRRSTALAEQLSQEAFFEILNDYFEGTAGAVLAHGGEVLRFIGDAVLAVFELVEPEASIADACARALDAARSAIRSIDKVNVAREASGRPIMEFGIGLHLGEVMYGNIGVPDRLEFSVIGSAANEASRVEDLCKTLHRPLVVSKRFARELSHVPWRDMGSHELRGVLHPIRAYSLDDAFLHAEPDAEMTEVA